MTIRFQVIGMASAPLPRWGWATVSWPLAVLDLDPSAATISFRWSWVKRLVLIISFNAKYGGNSSRTLWWSARTEEMSLILLGNRSFIIKSSRKGDCRFVVNSRAAMGRIAEHLSAWGVPVKHVRSTYRATLGMRKSR